MMRVTARLAGASLIAGIVVNASARERAMDSLSAASVERFATLALACIHKEYPNKIAHLLQSDADIAAPRDLTPAFFGCYDWHSSVHGHWLLARLSRLYPGASFAPHARAALAESLTPQHIAGEVRYLEGTGRVSFERPYGLAWLLQLHAELTEWNDPQARAWAEALDPLARLSAARLTGWLPKLTRPIRIGEHDQTAFALGLALDWARVAGDAASRDGFAEASRRFYLDDRGCPLNYEPSGEDFLSPCLAEADLVGRILPPADFAQWLDRFLPGLPRDGSGDWLEPGIVTDPTDPKLAHLDGLNLSRAWMMEGIAARLPESDNRRAALLAEAKRHRDASLPHVTSEHYEGGHWLGTFATYLVTGRGLPTPAPACLPAWYINTMRTTIDRAGRVVIPASIRQRTGLAAGVELEVTEDETGIRLERVAPGPRLVKVGRRLVARPTVVADTPVVDVAALVEGERNRWP